MKEKELKAELEIVNLEDSKLGRVFGGNMCEGSCPEGVDTLILAGQGQDCIIQQSTLCGGITLKE